MDWTDLADFLYSGRLDVGLDLACSNTHAFLVGGASAAYLLLVAGLVVGA